MTLLARYTGATALLALSGVGIAAGSVAGLLISETTDLFGFMEDGYRSAIVLSLLFEGATIVLLATYLAYSKDEMPCFIRYVRRHHIALLALFIALGGTSYAAVALPANSVGGKQIKKNAVTSAKVKNGSLRHADFAAGQLPAGVTGPAGRQGATGPPGPPGDKGDTGAMGEKGDSFDIVKEADAGANDSATPKSTTVPCPGGTLAIGGYHIAADTADAPIAVDTNHVQFPAAVSQWVVSAHETAPYPSNWQIQVFVTCVG